MLYFLKKKKSEKSEASMAHSSYLSWNLSEGSREHRGTAGPLNQGFSFHCQPWPKNIKWKIPKLSDS